MGSTTLENSRVSIRKCNITCVELPALVQNMDKMMDMIGGESAVSSTYSSNTKRLELKWRPDELYSKPAYGDRLPSTALLMKVIRRKRIKPDGTIYWTMSVELSGPVLCTYKFSGMTDYQYMSMARDGNKYNSLREDLILSRLENSSWINKPAPLFLVPVYFSRIDQPAMYAYRKEPTVRHPEKTTISQHLLGISRERRLHHTISHSFGDPIPQEPQPEAWNNLSTKEVEHGRIDELKQFFQERPIWSKNALSLRYTGYPTKLKFLLPVVAYYCTSGPWRTFWIRYGYDPRESPESKQYQTLDYRIRQRAGEKLVVSTAKRSPYFYALPTKTSKRALAARTSHFKLGKEVSQNDGNTVGESKCIYRPGQLPPYRQMFYQICDVLCSEVQALVHANDNMETECTEKDGWCLPGTIVKCRAILGQQMDKIREKTPVLKFYRSSKHGHSRRHIDAKRNLGKRRGLKSCDVNESESEDDQYNMGGNTDEEVNAMEEELIEHVTGVSMEEMTS